MTVIAKIQSGETAAGTSRYHITALARGLQLLAMLAARRGGMTVSAIAAESGWTITTAFRVASTLCHLGYLEHDKRSGDYELTYHCLSLGYSATVSLELTEIAFPDLQKLHDETHESVFLSILAGADIISTVRLLRSERFGALGDRFPAHATPNGKMLIAHLPARDQERLLTGTRWMSFTPKTIVDPAQLRKEFEKARLAGFAVTDDELVVGTRGIAAPIFDWDGQCVAAVAIVCAGKRLTVAQVIERYCGPVQITAERISALLRARYPISHDIGDPPPNGPAKAPPRLRRLRKK